MARHGRWGHGHPPSNSEATEEAKKLVFSSTLSRHTYGHGSACLPIINYCVQFCLPGTTAEVRTQRRVSYDNDNVAFFYSSCSKYKNYPLPQIFALSTLVPPRFLFSVVSSIPPSAISGWCEGKVCTSDCSQRIFLLCLKLRESPVSREVAPRGKFRSIGRFRGGRLAPLVKQVDTAVASSSFTKIVVWSYVLLL